MLWHLPLNEIWTQSCIGRKWPDVPLYCDYFVRCKPTQNILGIISRLVVDRPLILLLCGEAGYKTHTQQIEMMQLQRSLIATVVLASRPTKQETHPRDNLVLSWQLVSTDWLWRRSPSVQGDFMSMMPRIASWILPSHSAIWFLYVKLTEPRMYPQFMAFCGTVIQKSIYCWEV